MLALILQPHSLVHANRSSQQGQPFDGRFTTRRNDLSRGIQSILIKKQALSKTRGWKSPTRKTAPSVQGSILTFQKPTKARIWRWFGVDEAPGSLRCMLQRQFNHGMLENCIFGKQVIDMRNLHHSLSPLRLQRIRGYDESLRES